MKALSLSDVQVLKARTTYCLRAGGHADLSFGLFCAEAGAAAVK